MMPHKQISYFRIGSFVITGIVLLIIGILVFGSGMLFKRVTYIETYFNESVQGLVIGSPVKYLGMEIGHVDDIMPITGAYDINYNVLRLCSRYVYVKMAISPKFLESLTKEDLKERIKQDIESGLRFKLAPQGLTGNVYVELDFVDPKTHPELSIYWEPKYLYIPSTTSILTYFTDNAQYILRELRKVDFQKLFNSIQNLTDSTNELMFKADRLLTATQQPAINVMNNAQSISQNLNALSEQANAFPSHMFFGKPPPKLDLGKL
jgi:paraquat-inducible protein B